MTKPDNYSKETEQIERNRRYFLKPRSFEDFSIDIFSESDISDNYLSWLNDSYHMQFSDQQLKVHTVETAKDYIDSFKNTANLFLKILNNSGVMVGTLTVYIDVIMDIHNCGILIDSNLGGKGYGKKAWTALTRQVCPSLGARRIVAGTVESNFAMIKLFEASDMSFETRLHDEKHYGRKSHDVLIYSRTVLEARSQ
jgi:RimJ/RimL family protein N-acetyltransferase